MKSVPFLLFTTMAAISLAIATDNNLYGLTLLFTLLTMREIHDPPKN